MKIMKSMAHPPQRWVEGHMGLCRLFELGNGRLKFNEYELWGWVDTSWRQFCADKHPTQAVSVLYCYGHRLETEFFEWLEAKALLKGALAA